jgi:hypothetical protein
MNRFIFTPVLIDIVKGRILSGYVPTKNFRHCSEYSAMTEA